MQIFCEIKKKTYTKPQADKDQARPAGKIKPLL